MRLREFKFVFRLHRQCDCRIRIVTLEHARVPRGHKVLTRAEGQFLSLAYKCVCYLTVVCCSGYVHVVCDDSDPVYGAVRLEYLKVVPADVGIDVGWCKPKHVATGRFQ